MIPRGVKVKNSILPDAPGVYFMKDSKGKLLYVGKAGSLKRRVTSYFLRPHDSRIQKMVSEIRAIDYEETDTALEALILESALIKKFQPPFNVKEKDGKSFLYVEITKDKFPRVILVRGKDLTQGKYFGPFTSASSIREALRIIRKIFPWSVHAPEKIGTFKRPCFDYEVGLCPGTCIGAGSRTEYMKNIRNIKLFFEGKKRQIVIQLKKEMKEASAALEFERAEKFQRQIFALQHIRDVALISESEFNLPATTYQLQPTRIEGYDISNISGTSAVGSMVVFENGAPNKSEYRKFKIRTFDASNDVGMMREVLRRRFQNSWPLPQVILIDGGAPQVNVAHKVLAEFSLQIPIVGIAKGPERKKNEFIGTIPAGVTPLTLIRVRDEAHRFAITYHKKLRAAKSLVG